MNSYVHFVVELILEDIGDSVCGLATLWHQQEPVQVAEK